VKGKQGRQLYAVNDRPVAVVPVDGGGADCLVFDFGTGEMIPDRAYFAYVTPGSGADTDVLTEAEFEARLAAYRADAGTRLARQVQEWAHRLCEAAGAAVAVALALGLTGAAGPEDAVTADPVPAGYRQITVTSEPRRVAVRIRPAGRLLPREILDAGLGVARELPIFPDSGDEGHLEYTVGTPDGPDSCSDCVRIRQGAAAEIVLRREGPP
jgi:hypothetical protein